MFGEEESVVEGQVGAASVLEVVQTAIAYDPGEPGTESRRVPATGEVGERLHQRILNDVGGCVVAADHAEGEPEEGILVALHEQGEALPVAREHPGDDHLVGRPVQRPAERLLAKRDRKST